MVAGLILLGGCAADLPRGATSVLQLFREPSPSEAAAWALDKYDADKRERGLRLLGTATFGGEDLYLRLYRDRLTDPAPGVRLSAVRALANHGTPDDVPLILARLEDDDAQVRREAARGLQRLSNPVAIDPLLRLTSEEREVEPEVRAEAAEALGQYAESRVVEGLVAALDDRNLAVNHAALRSLRTLTGQDFGYDRRAWVPWLSSEQRLFAARSQYVYPVFQRAKAWYEYIPLFPPPPNEPAASPAGLPPLDGT